MAVLREAMTPRYKTDAITGAQVPDVRAAAAIIFNPETGEILWQENAQDKRSDRQHHQGHDRGGVSRRLSRPVAAT